MTGWTGGPSHNRAAQLCLVISGAGTVTTILSTVNNSGDSHGHSHLYFLTLTSKMHIVQIGNIVIRKKNIIFGIFSKFLRLSVFVVFFKIQMSVSVLVF